MSTKAVRIPGPDHPIAIARHAGRVVVTVAGQVIADTREALTMAEADLPPVHYVPRADVDMAALRPSATSTYCPYKGDAGYFSIVVGDSRSVDAVWTYEAPYDAVAAIAGRLAFYPERVEAIDVTD